MLPIIDKNPKKGQEKATMHSTQCYRGTSVYVNSIGTHNMSQCYARVILLKPEQLGQFKKHT